MRKLLVIFVLILLVTLGLNASTVAQNGIWTEIDMARALFPWGEWHEIEITFSGEDVEKVRVVRIVLPTGKYMVLRNTFGLREVGLGAWGMSYDEFKERFPEGIYRIFFWPRRYGGKIVTMTHDFPPDPIILSPQHNDVVPHQQNLTVMWEQLGGVTRVELAIEGGGTEVEFSPSPGDTSFEVPYSLLKPNTWYELRLEAVIDTTGESDDLATSQRIFFVTTPQ